MEDTLKLKEAGVTRFGLLSQDAATLKTLSGVNLKNLLKLRKNLTQQFAAKWSSGLSVLCETERSSFIWKTGFEELDEVLGGGLHSGEITLIVNTNIISSISSLMISKINSDVTFIDTADHFDSVNTDISYNTRGFMHQIKVFNIIEYLEIVEDLRQKDKLFCSVLVTDCFTDLVASYIGGLSIDDLIIYVKKSLLSLKMIAMQHKSAILLFCRDVELSQRLMLSNLLHTMVDSALCSDEDDDIKLTLTKSIRQPTGKSFTILTST